MRYRPQNQFPQDIPQEPSNLYKSLQLGRFLRVSSRKVHPREVAFGNLLNHTRRTKNLRDDGGLSQGKMLEKYRKGSSQVGSDHTQSLYTAIRNIARHICKVGDSSHTYRCNWNELHIFVRIVDLGINYEHTVTHIDGPVSGPSDILPTCAANSYEYSPLSER